MVLAAGLLAVSACFAQEPEQELIRTRLEALPERPLVDGVHVHDARVLMAVYAQRGYLPAWLRRSDADAFVSLIGRAEAEGLDPGDYHYQALSKMLAERDSGLQSDMQIIELDLLLTDSLLRYAYHLRFGKVDPNDLYPDWSLRRAMPGPDTLERLQTIIDSADPQHALAAAVPQSAYYEALKRSLEHYRTLRDQGGWLRIPSGPALKVGTVDPRVHMLRERLGVVESSAPASSAAPDWFDSALERAVSEFQARHGLASDGVVGKATLAALNVPVQARIDQLRVNMERARWVFDDYEDTYLWINIAAYDAAMFRHGRRIWSARTVVGKPFRETPVFKSKITYLVFNPTWTVPPTILREDILPRLKDDPGFLERQNMKILDLDGNAIDATFMQWDTVDARKFPYMIRQEPGPGNALGRIKFMLPNPYFVYLHDTPQKELFQRPDRSFSSGCIRIENVVELAELLLDDPRNWDHKAILDAMRNGRTQSVSLATPVTALVLYLTNEVDEAGNVRFLNDVYNRDGVVLEALNGPFVFSPPSGFDTLFPGER